MSDQKYTTEQEDILKNVYKYKRKAELTQEEIDAVLEMFDKPEKFVILRKMLQVFSDDEREIDIPSEAALINTNPGQLQEYGLQVAINMRADEKIRQALASFYTKVKTWHVSEKEAEFDEALRVAKEEEVVHEKMAEDAELSKKRAGENV